MYARTADDLARSQLQKAVLGQELQFLQKGIETNPDIITLEKSETYASPLQIQNGPRTSVTRTGRNPLQVDLRARYLAAKSGARSS